MKGICEYLGVEYIKRVDAVTIDDYKDIIQEKCNFSEPEAVWELFDQHKYPTALYEKFAKAMK